MYPVPRLLGGAKRVVRGRRNLQQLSTGQLRTHWVVPGHPPIVAVRDLRRLFMEPGAHHEHIIFAWYAAWHAFGGGLVHLLEARLLCPGTPCGAFVRSKEATLCKQATTHSHTQPHTHTRTHTGQQPHISPGHGVPSSPVTEGNSKLICNAPARRCSRRGTAVSSPLSTRPRDALCTSSCCWCTCMHTHTCGQHAAAVRAGKGSATYVPDVGGKHGGADTECSVVSRPAAWLPAPAPAPAPAPVPTEPPACDRLPVLRFFLGILGATAGANDRRRSRQVIMTTPRRPTHTRVANQKGRHQAALVGLAVGRVALPLPCRASTTRSAALPAPAMPPPVDAAVDRPCRVAAPAPCL